MLSGQLGPIGLDEVVAFLHTNGLEGVLTVVGAAASLQLVLQQGRLVCPEPRAGGLGPDVVGDLLARAAGLRQGRKLSRGQVDDLMARARAVVNVAPSRTGRLGKDDLAALVDRAGGLRAGPDPKPRTGRLDKDALAALQGRASALDGERRRRRARLEEQVHDLFRLDKARFEFRPLAVPAGVVADLERGGGLVLEPTALLMEVARRNDERSRGPADAASRTRTARRVSIAGEPGPRRGGKPPLLEGDLDGVGLAALLQTLRARRRKGTLMVTAGPREEHLYFDGGEAFVLRAGDVGVDEEFAAAFLGDAADSVSALASAAIDERKLSPGELRVIKDKFLDVLFWEGARFAFYLDDLPSAFLKPPRGVTKIALQTDRFLLEAIQRMIEWDGLREVVRGGQVVFGFVTPDAKLHAIRGAPQASVLTLLDGRQSFDDLVRISREPRLEVGRIVADLVRRGLVRELGGP